MLDLMKIQALGEIPVDNQSNYRRTIENIDLVFEQSSCLYLFYEQLFSDETIGRLSDFLCLPYRPPASEARVNSCPAGDAPPAMLEDIATQIYRPVYDFVQDRFGCLPREWRPLK
jgi:hypothetical protein